MSWSRGACTVCCEPPFIASLGAFCGVMIVSTPGNDWAAVRSKAVITPAPTVLCTSTACTTSGTANSAAYFARPVTFRRPSTRSIGCPMIAITRLPSGGRRLQRAQNRAPQQGELELVLLGRMRTGTGFRRRLTQRAIGRSVRRARLLQLPADAMAGCRLHRRLRGCRGLHRHLFPARLQRRPMRTRSSRDPAL